MSVVMKKIGSGFQITLREALAIQERQLEFYEPRFPQLRAAAAMATNVEGMDLDTSMPCTEVIKLVPRGCFLGYLIGESF